MTRSTKPEIDAEVLETLKAALTLLPSDIPQTSKALKWLSSLGNPDTITRKTLYLVIGRAAGRANGGQGVTVNCAKEQFDAVFEAAKGKSARQIEFLLTKYFSEKAGNTVNPRQFFNGFDVVAALTSTTQEPEPSQQKVYVKAWVNVAGTMQKKWSDDVVGERT